MFKYYENNGVYKIYKEGSDEILFITGSESSAITRCDSLNNK